MRGYLFFVVESDLWRVVLIGGLALNAVLGFGYRVYRLSRGGPLGDVLGQGVLAVLLLGIVVALSLGAQWARWVAMTYGLLFALVVMPLWILAVLIPLGPRAPDYAFAAVYWMTLVLIVIAALLV